MKYIIVLYQKRLLELTPEIRSTEAIILDYLVSICGSQHRRIESQRHLGYTWVDYSKLVEDLPLLGFKTTQMVKRYMKKLEDLGYISTITSNVDYKKRKYVKLTEKVDEIYFDPIDSDGIQNYTIRGSKSILNTNIILSNKLERGEKNLSDQLVTKDVTRSEDSGLLFDYDRSLDMLIKSKKKILRIVGLYWKSKGFRHPSKKAFDAALGRDLKAAKNLEGYPDDAILGVFSYFNAKNSQDFEWKLETVFKTIDHYIAEESR